MTERVLFDVDGRLCVCRTDRDVQVSKGIKELCENDNELE